MCLITHVIHFTEEKEDVKIFISFCSREWVEGCSCFDLSARLRPAAELVSGM